MNGTELAGLLDRALARFAESRDELRDLDAAVGDGDLGITLTKGCEAIRARLADLAEPSPAQVVRTAGAAAANANPSTMGALVGGGLMAGAKAIGDEVDLGREATLRFGRAVTENIAARGKAEPGDKTILDAMVPSLDALEASSGDAGATLGAMIAAARRGVEETAALQSRRGRAAWLGERSAGHPDPGATAYVRFLEALAEALGVPPG